MFPREPIFHSGDPEKIWQKFCGFLDLSLAEFMETQEELLLEQIELVAGSPLGKKIMNGHKPKSIQEFRRQVPLTRYADYAPSIGDCQEEALAIKPTLWAHTSGRGGAFKWVPYTMRALEKHGDASLGTFILATTERKGEVKIKEGSRFLSILAPRPYLSGISAWLYVERFGLRLIPPPELAEKLEFQERIEVGFQMALRSGVDVIAAIGTVLVKMGERLTNRSQKVRLSVALLHPMVISHLLRAWLRSKLHHRAILPADLWPIKGLVCSGTDAGIYSDQIKGFWGKVPYQAYGFSEAGLLAMQSWLKKGLIFYPYLCFFEFIPEAEWLKSQENKNYQPATVLLNELQAGQIYEIVVTNYYGMPFLRYRPGDLIRIISIEEPETGIKIPQFTFYTRADGLIDLYSIVRLDEKTIWQALTDTGVSYEDWSARKEYEQSSQPMRKEYEEGSQPVLRLYIESKQEVDAKVLEQLLHDKLLAISPLYQEAVAENETNPVRVTVLSNGSFQSYYEAKQKAGADLAHLKPPRMNASDAVIRDLLHHGENNLG